MTFLAFGAADVFDGNGVYPPILEIAEEGFVDGVEFVAVYAVWPFGKVDFCGSVTVDTPAHAEGGELFDLVHLLDGAVTGLALYMADVDVLRMIEIDQVGKVVNPDPFDGMARFRIPVAVRVPASVAV